MMATNDTPQPGQGHDRISKVETTDPPAAIPPSPESTMTDRMISAISGSVLTSLLVTPLDVVRVRLQSQQPPTGRGDFSHVSAPAMRSFSNLPPNLGVTACCREVFWVNNNAAFCVATPGVAHVGGGAALSAQECAVEEVQRKSFTSTFDGLKKIARNEGITTLWRGLSPTLVMAVPGNVIYFAGYDWLRSSPQSPMSSRLTPETAPLIAGSTARVLAALVVSPIELFRTRMQATQSQSAAANFRETLSSVQDMVNTQGYHTLWRGLSMTLWRDVPFSAFYWWGYERSRKLLLEARHGTLISPESMSDLRRQQTHSATFVDSFTAGLVSGGVSAVCTTPFDVGKTRQQVFHHAGDSARAGTDIHGSLGPGDQSMPRMLMHIFREEGMAGLFRGWAPRVLKVAPACAIMISSYEFGKKTAEKAREVVVE